MLKACKLKNNFDIIVAIAMFISSFIMLILYIHFYGLSGRVVITIFSMLLASIIYIIYRNKKNKQDNNQYITTQILCIYIIYLLLFNISNYILYFNLYVRPPVYFVIISVLSIIVIFEIDLTKSAAQEAIIIFKIILISISLRLGILYEFPGLLGIDPPYHMPLVNIITSTGYIPEGGGIYFGYPMSYILTSINELIIGFDYKNSLIFGVGIPMIISIFFVYLLGRLLFNKKTGLIAALFISAFPFHILYSYILIPNSIGFVYFSIIIYLIFSNQPSMKILTLIVLFSLLFSHPLVPPIFMFTIIAFSVGSHFYNIFEKKIIPMFSIKLIIIAIFFRWMYAFLDAPIIGNIIQNMKYLLTNFDNPKIITTSPFVGVSNDFFNESLNTVGIALLTMLAMVGVLFILKKERNNRTFGFVTAGLSVFAITSISAAMGLNFLLPQRWLVFLGIFLAIFAAYGLNNISSNNIIKITVVFILIFFMITNSFSNMDSPIYSKSETVRYAYTESEIYSANTINRIVDGRIIMDVLYSSYFRSIPRDVDYIELPLNFSRNGTLIVRDYMINHPIYILSKYASNIMSLSDQDKIIIYQINFNQNRIYTNGLVNAYSHNLTV